MTYNMLFKHISDDFYTRFGMQAIFFCSLYWALATERRKEIEKHRKEIDKIFFLQKIMLPDVAEGIPLLKKPTNQQNQTKQITTNQKNKQATKNPMITINYILVNGI